ncbi:ASCH domain-containing protein [Palleronia caenipelagi]|nr:ASCH domain-containing protein [Palleronia caenipelagi]
MRRYPGATTFTFGDCPELSARLLALVRQGQKTATCGALRDFGVEGEPLPVQGRRDIALNWDGTPELVIETTSVEILHFDEVPEVFALAEGENTDLAGWRADHRAFFTQNGGWSEDMLLVCERFHLVEDLSPCSENS